MSGVLFTRILTELKSSHAKNFKSNMFSCPAVSDQFQMHLNVVDWNVRRFIFSNLDRITKYPCETAR